MPPTNTIDGRGVIKVISVVWQFDDDVVIRNSTVLGRAIVDVEGGGRFHALVYMPFVPLGQLGNPVAVIWERSSGRFAAIQVHPEPESHGKRRG